MKARIFRELKDGVYQISIATEEWSESDRNLMRRFGEPEINLGGTFNEYEGEAFTLPASLVRIARMSPFIGRFDSRDYDNGESVAEAWQAQIMERLTTAVSALRDNEDGFTGEEVVSL